MTNPTVSVKFQCKKCGGKVLALPENPTDDSIATCKSCGVEFGRWGDIRAKAREKVADAVRKEFKEGIKKAFKGVPGIKIK